MMRGRLHLLAAPASSTGTMMQVTFSCTHDGRCTLHNGNRILWHHTPQCVRTVSVSLLSLSLRTHRWTWHTQRHVRNQLFFLFPRTSHSSTAKRVPLLLSRIPLRHASCHMHQPTSVHVVSLQVLAPHSRSSQLLSSGRITLPSAPLGMNPRMNEDCCRPPNQRETTTDKRPQKKSMAFFPYECVHPNSFHPFPLVSHPCPQLRKSTFSPVIPERNVVSLTTIKSTLVRSCRLHLPSSK
ncbi:hypothetical protein TCDM_13626 [Trypanosoma cruzi Dm28c]|uniref:Uncharacterized protein n=1 Tax=Trypanosoma cruzi Dm28c TaxID=1416333 RepID=V5AMP3_TRYCR|nr:hypothetical protein TCDM_13626 [Trypanosoma cruzi Dm28c]